MEFRARKIVEVEFDIPDVRLRCVGERARSKKTEDQALSALSDYMELLMESSCFGYEEVGFERFELNKEDLSVIASQLHLRKESGK